MTSCLVAQAIVAYCDGAGCNKGPLGNNDDGGEEQTSYLGRTYSYSGYNGNSHVAGGTKGNEYLKVSGLVNTPLMMKAYGYASGTVRKRPSSHEDPLHSRPF